MALIVSGLFCLPALAQKANIQGRVITDQGVAVKSATVRLETEDGELVADQPVSTGGDFYFHFITKMHYQLIVRAEGFQPYQQSLDLAEGANDYNITVTLTPEGGKRGPREIPSLTDAQAPGPARHEYQKGARALASRKLGDARKHLEAAVEAYPCYARAQTDLAIVLTEQKDFKDAEEALKKSISCDPGFVDAHLELGGLLNAEKRFGEAKPILDQGVRQSPAAWQFYYQLGIAEYGLKQYKAAEMQLTKAASLTPQPPGELKVQLANVYLKESAYTKAYTEMQDYLKIDPDSRLAPRIKEIMKQMQSSGVLQAQQAQSSPGTPH